jgi:hypothetical protein
VPVADGRQVRDVCPSALACGIPPAESVTRARRLCPALLVVPLETIDAIPEDKDYIKQSFSAFVTSAWSIGSTMRVPPNVSEPAPNTQPPLTGSS